MKARWNQKAWEKFYNEVYMSDWATAVAKAIALGETDCQFAIPDGAHLGDLFFITSSENKILFILVWTETKWVSYNLLGDGNV